MRPFLDPHPPPSPAFHYILSFLLPFLESLIFTLVSLPFFPFTVRELPALSIRSKSATADPFFRGGLLAFFSLFYSFLVCRGIAAAGRYIRGEPGGCSPSRWSQVHKEKKWGCVESVRIVRLATRALPTGSTVCPCDGTTLYQGISRELTSPAVDSSFFLYLVKIECVIRTYDSGTV
jgi:hypothetical protein